MTELKWLESVKDAQMALAGTHKLVLMFFHHPNCGGCKKTLHVTFEDNIVKSLIDHLFTPVSFKVTEAQEMTARYAIEWTPTFIIADEHMRELERWVGYLPPEDFVSQVTLSYGLASMHTNKLREAENAFAWILDNHPSADVAPQARYYLGVALYKETGDPEHLLRTWESMSKRYPGNFWTKKASAWSQA